MPSPLAASHSLHALCDEPRWKAFCEQTFIRRIEGFRNRSTCGVSEVGRCAPIDVIHDRAPERTAYYDSPLGRLVAVRIGDTDWGPVPDCRPDYRPGCEVGASMWTDSSSLDR